MLALPPRILKLPVGTIDGHVKMGDEAPLPPSDRSPAVVWFCVHSWKAELVNILPSFCGIRYVNILTRVTTTKNDSKHLCFEFASLMSSIFTCSQWAAGVCGSRGQRSEVSVLHLGPETEVDVSCILMPEVFCFLFFFQYFGVIQ